MDDKLFLKLKEKRDELKRRPTDGGRTPLVCNDAALNELARLKPKTKEELLYVSGLGKTFADKYGDEFMRILSDYHAERKTTSEIMLPKVREVLKSLENRLVNINKRNRLLYMPKLSARFGIDLASDDGLYGLKLLDFIKKQDGAARLKILDLTQGDSAENEKRYKEFKTLMRESERSKRESGESTLYIGYPFVQGKMSGENFNVRAPLALFPVQLMINADNVCIKMDTDKDALYNSALILTHFKFSGKNEVVPNNTVEEFKPSEFLDDLTQFFDSYGISIKRGEGGEVKKFQEYGSAQFPKYRGGQYEMVQNVVLGKFSLYSSALQQDFKQLIEGGRINDLLNELLRSVDDADIYSDSEEKGEMPAIAPPSERDLNYINELNISQENAIYNINNNNRLVMQGPPGTGKSQAITSMIADFVNKGKNVLMVSQKKAALDVIYSRLGKLSKYAVMLSDVKNKEYFYDQLYRIFTAEEKAAFDINKFNKISDEIDGGLKKLDAVADRLYYDTGYGAPMYKIYDENLYDKFQSANSDELKIFSSNIVSQLLEYGYAEIKEMRDYFDNDKLLSACVDYYDLAGAFPWLSQTNENYSRIEISGILKEIDGFVDAYAHYKAKSPIGRLFSKGKYKKALKPIMKRFFAAYDRNLFKFFLKNPTVLYNGFKEYERFRSLKIVFDELSERHKLYFGCLYNVFANKNTPIVELNREIKDYAAYYYITKFENENREVLSALETFDITVRDISNKLAAKKEESRKRLSDTLIGDYNANIALSKRKGEMLRVIESKRKWSISRFVNKFNFELFKGLRIWLMTPEVVSEVLPLDNGLFDLVIFDEASQIYIEKGVPSIARAKKVVIAGDHKQLRPSSLGEGRMDYDDVGEDDSELNAALEEESLLDLARFRFPEVLLNYHYRSKYEELIAFSNYAFYKGRLNISPNNVQPSSPPISVHKVENGLWEDRCNLAEAEATVALLKKYLYMQKRTQTLGVITFNSSQRDLIQDLLDKECLADAKFSKAYSMEINRTQNGEDVGLFVKNIENVQGDERDVIIFSLAYAKNKAGKVVRSFGWLNQSGGENRLNVAVSRAKEKIHIVTSIVPSELKVDDLKNEGPRAFKKYLEYAYAVSDDNREVAREVLRSFGNFNTRTYEYNDDFVLEVFRSLHAMGLNVEQNVGIGGYKIDLAIKDDDGNYLLGIECDSNLYNRSCISRERDVHRQRYLESRGWKMHRVWSCHWWHNKNAQLKKILAAASIEL